jgi:hypothetical protein
VLVPIIADPRTVDEKFTGTITGTTPATAPQTGSITGSQQPSPVDPNYHEFEVGPEFKYITSQLTWGKSWNPLSDITERGKDPDLQLYSDQIGQVGASEKWNVLEGASEEIDSYLYNPGGWKFAVTYMPTKSPLDQDPDGWMSVPPAGTVSAEGQQSYKTERLKELMNDRAEMGLDPDLPGDSTVEYIIDYTLYPGIDIPDKVATPFYCRDATFKLEWTDNAQSLGLILRGPEGAEIAVANAATLATAKCPAACGKTRARIAKTKEDAPFAITWLPPRRPPASSATPRASLRP